MYGQVSHMELQEMEAEFFGKKARERRKKRRDERAARKESKIRVRNEGKTQRAGLFANVLGGAKDAIFGGAAAPTVPINSQRKYQEDEDEGNDGKLPPGEAKGPSTTTIIVIVLVVAVLGFLAAKFMQNSKA